MRAARALFAFGACLAGVAACTTLLDIQDRKLRPSTDGGLGTGGTTSSTGGVSSNGGVPGTGAAFGGGGVPGTGAAFGGGGVPGTGGAAGACEDKLAPMVAAACAQCLCNQCPTDVVTACGQSDCGSLLDCVERTGCQEPASCTSTCEPTASSAGISDTVESELLNCAYSECPSPCWNGQAGTGGVTGSGGSGGVGTCSSNVPNDRCWSCLCANCDAPDFLICVGAGVPAGMNCEAMVACMASTKCVSTGNCTAATSPCAAIVSADGPAGLASDLAGCMMSTQCLGVCSGNVACGTNGDGAPCYDALDEPGFCVAGACQHCTPVTDDASCKKAWGPAYYECCANGCCGASGAGGAGGTGGASGTGCTGNTCTLPGIGSGMCIGGVCTGCGAGTNQPNTQCQAYYGAALGCCSPTGACETCPSTGCTGLTCSSGANKYGLCESGACASCSSDAQCSLAYAAYQCCSASGSCVPCTAVCGDGIVESGEACDDGANNGSATSLCTTHCTLKCGDGVIEPPEQCDNGAAANTGSYGQCNPNCTLGPRCGDSILQPGEACDDGNNSSGDGCSSACQVETGYICDMGAGSPCRVVPP